tara:strand:- start:412 stop:1113 length:702 start_codon:yes stop_codon:yes gene_type:complete
MKTPPPSAKLNILCLCGYAQNAEFFRSRTGALRKALKSTCEFHFLEPPHEATASFLTADADGDGRRALGWWNAAEDAARPSTSKAYVGLDASLEAVRDAVREHGPFDGVLGFSQGATLAALLCLTPAEMPPFRFAVLFSGFMPRDASLEPLFGVTDGPPPAQLALPSLHVMGTADALVPVSSSRRLAECFADPLIHTHEGGHAVISSAELRAQLKEFVGSNVAAPSESPADAP